MREILDTILVFIQATPLTNAEYATIAYLTEESATVDVYTALDGVLASRGSFTRSRERLRYYFLARGVELPGELPGSSQMFVGGVL